MKSSFKEKLISEITFDLIRSTGPGGQNVNKVSTAVQIHFNIPNSTVLPQQAKERLFLKAKNKIANNGVFTLTARRFRSQGQNRIDAINRFLLLVESIEKIPKKRVATKPTNASQEKRLLSKKKHGELKKFRNSGVKE